MTAYLISTDSSLMNIEAGDLAEALREFGDCPKSVTDASQFEAWLERVGGYGFIEADGVRIAYVAS